MIDFTSSSYLGLRHAGIDLRPWAQLTTGVPAALGEPPLAASVAARLASLMGLPAATLASSTLHGFWDLFMILGPRTSTIFVDGGTYPIARWSIERAVGRGAASEPFPHHDPVALRAQLVANADIGSARRRPVVVADGFCPGCGSVAPVARYLEAASDMAGVLVLDDTQALGVLGTPASGHPYGRGGGGILRWAGGRSRADAKLIDDADIIVVASLAKAFGVPLAVVAGSAPFVARYRRLAETRVHCSPPSAADLAAAEHALNLNASEGDARRRRLARNVAAFRTAVTADHVALASGGFPMQTIRRTSSLDVSELHARLLASGVRGVLHGSRCRAEPALSLIFRAAHNREDVAAAAAAVRRALRKRRPVSGLGPRAIASVST